MSREHRKKESASAISFREAQSGSSAGDKLAVSGASGQLIVNITCVWSGPGQSRGRTARLVDVVVGSPLPLGESATRRSESVTPRLYVVSSTRSSASHCTKVGYSCLLV